MKVTTTAIKRTVGKLKRIGPPLNDGWSYYTPDGHCIGPFAFEEERERAISERYIEIDTPTGTAENPLAIVKEQDKSVQVQVMELLQQASASLTRASAIAEQANPMVSSVPVFAEMKETSKKITGMMQAVGKIRGLDK